MEHSVPRFIVYVLDVGICALPSIINNVRARDRLDTDVGRKNTIITN